MKNIKLISFLCILLLLPFQIFSGVLTRGRILFETSGYKNKTQQAVRAELEPSLGLPCATDDIVLSGYEFWDSFGKRHTGNYIPVASASVLSGTSFGPNGSIVGAYISVSEDNVRNGIGYGNSKTGNLVLPSTNTVLNGIGYGASGTELIGKYVPAGNDPGTSTNDATSSFVLTNREYWSQSGARRTGSYFPVSISNVRSGITFGSNKSLTGVYTSDANVSPRKLELGVIAYSNSKKIIGDLTNRNSIFGNEGVRTTNLPDGIYIGKTATANDMDLRPDNIRYRVNIFQTNGLYSGSPLRTGQITSYVATDDANRRKGYTCGYTNSNGSWNGTTRFSNMGSGVILDKMTSLMWSQNANLGSGLVNWSTAISTAAGYSGLGYSDWRLPNINELMSLQDYQNYMPSLPTGSPFINVQNNFYWTSTTYRENTSYAWGVGFGEGHIEETLKTSINAYVWACRGGE
ncbi:MAG: DUF1566 domain-containing protein [Candidatus Nanoarchaeia archaeon]|nr:DUF1566 domain-containing protein [Candidatus Nanoarchaeia archaeon]